MHTFHTAFVTRLFFALFVSCVAVFGAAEDRLGLQPAIFVAKMADGETVEFSWFSEKTVLADMVAKVDVVEELTVYAKDAEGRLTTQSVKKPQTREVNYIAEKKIRDEFQIAVKLDRLTVYGTDGQEISRDSLPQRLKEAVPVVVSANGSIVDPFYLSILKEGTLIFVSQDPRFPAVVSRPLPPPAEREPQADESPSDSG